MFTGLIEEIGQVARIEKAGESARLTVEAPGMAVALEIGESVAVDGACLTVETRTNTGFVAFASEETLKRTTLGGVSAGRRVNLERALRLGDRLGGHLVAGHVDATECCRRSTRSRGLDSACRGPSGNSGSVRTQRVHYSGWGQFDSGGVD
jgi:riboflavin synthase